MDDLLPPPPPPPLSGRSSSVGSIYYSANSSPGAVCVRKSSLSQFDSDQLVPVAPSSVDPNSMFDELGLNTPAAEALKANSELPNPSKLDELLYGSKGILKKKPKLKNLTKDVKKKSRRRQSHIKGKRIDGKHEQYALSIGMMLGIRVCVGKTEQLLPGQAPPPLTFQDFMQVDKYIFPPNGNTDPDYPLTPPHQLSHEFKFKAYAPRIFAAIRTLFGVEAGHFMLSICGNYNFIEFISNAKSGQFFFYSHDGRYMIKTQTDSESKFLRRIMPHYYQYLAKNPHSFLTHFYGMYRVKMNHLRRNVHFVIMKSVFNTDKRIHKVWDLKGSTIGRKARPGESVLKDLDLLTEKRAIKVGPERKAVIMRQVANDTKFLANLEIMDYSLLLGIHDRRQGDEPPDAKPGEEANRSDTPLRRARHDEAQGAEGGGGGTTAARDTNGGGTSPAKDAAERTSKGEEEEEEEEKKKPSFFKSLFGIGTSKEKTSESGPKQSESGKAGPPPPAAAQQLAAAKPATNGPRRSKDLLPGAAGIGAQQDDEVSERNEKTGSGTDTETDAGGDKDYGSEDESEYGDDEVDESDIEGGGGTSSPGSRPKDAKPRSERGKVKAPGGEMMGRGRRFSNEEDDLLIASAEVMAIEHIVAGMHTEANPWSNRKDWGIDSTEKLEDKADSAAEHGHKRPGNPGHHGSRSAEVYFCGIIDVLQQYNARKRAETFFKGFGNNSKQISCVDPQWYAERFYDFLDKALE